MTVFSLPRLADDYLCCNLTFPPWILSEIYFSSHNPHAPQALLFVALPSFLHFLFPDTLPMSLLYYKELILFLHSINNRLLIRIIMESQIAAEQNRGNKGNIEWTSTGKKGSIVDKWFYTRRWWTPSSRKYARGKKGQCEYGGTKRNQGKAKKPHRVQKDNSWARRGEKKWIRAGTGGTWNVQGWGKMESVMNDFQAQKEGRVCERASAPAESGFDK